MAFRDADAEMTPHPRYVVWELTLRCDLHCKHCGSRAGKPRRGELSVDEAREVVAQLAAAGTREVTFIGGEAYLYEGWLELVEAVADAGMAPTMTTGARGVDAELVRKAADAGMKAMSCSIDGLEATHDHLRNLKGSWRRAVDALGHIRDAGMAAHANTQFNRANLDECEALGELFHDRGVRVWQVQLTGPMGRAADEPDLLLQPYQMLELVPRLGRLAERLRPQGLSIEASNNLGYYGPFEKHLRRSHWQGCQAGRFVLGIEANGDVKGCPSLPSAPYVGGNLRDMPLTDILETRRLRFSQDRDLDELWGHCKGCYYAEMCRGGCSWTSHTLLGKRGNMPYCHHRALELQSAGIRERVQWIEAAPGLPFDFGRYELVEEPWPEEADAPTPA
ncbi:MAG: radical SAM protein [Deltaproteobacteria bacterium]|nr:MAG: radical SAM protein [Deltaproteobacteria bacterium]